MSEKNKTIQEKMSALSELIAWFQGESFDIEESVDVFKKAEVLAADIEKDLLSLKNDIEVVTQRFNA